MGSDVMVTISDVLEYQFCPRYIYYMYCLSIPQYEDRRFKVQKGRDIHNRKKIENAHYLRKKLGVIGRRQELFLFSEKYHIRGIVDDVLELNDGTMAPFEYKFSEYNNVVADTYLVQLAFQALLIRETFNVPVTRGYICFIRSMNHIEEVVLKMDDLQSLEMIITRILDIVQKGYYPNATTYKNRCIDCTYRNICV